MLIHTSRAQPIMRTLFPLLHRSMTASLLLVCGSALAVETNWPMAPKLIELPTPYGTLAVGESEYVYEARLHLDGTQIEPQITGMLNITYAFSMRESQAALVAISKGNDACPVSYRWVVLRADGYQVSPEFGSCSEHIRVSADAKRLTLQTPSRETPGALDTYVYDGKTVTQRTGKEKEKRK